jgi:hypothetical protein
MRARENLLVVVQVLRHRDQMVLDVREVEALWRAVAYEEAVSARGPFTSSRRQTRGRTMSDLGATLQLSLHRLAKPLTTSALLPISRSRPMTFLRHVPIRRSMSLCSASLRIRTSSSTAIARYAQSVSGCLPSCQADEMRTHRSSRPRTRSTGRAGQRRRQCRR